ncbi:hypothetical protein [Deinococcus roseus]|nr:hypothetical protein [Deinococcus roseus]
MPLLDQFDLIHLLQTWQIPFKNLGDFLEVEHQGTHHLLRAEAREDGLGQLLLAYPERPLREEHWQILTEHACTDMFMRSVQTRADAGLDLSFLNSAWVNHAKIPPLIWNAGSATLFLDSKILEGISSKGYFLRLLEAMDQKIQVYFSQVRKETTPLQPWQQRPEEDGTEWMTAGHLQSLLPGSENWSMTRINELSTLYLPPEELHGAFPNLDEVGLHVHLRWSKDEHDWGCLYFRAYTEAPKVPHKTEKLLEGHLQHLEHLLNQGRNLSAQLDPDGDMVVRRIFWCEKAPSPELLKAYLADIELAAWLTYAICVQ